MIDTFEKIPIVVKPNKDFCEEDFIDEVYKLKLKFCILINVQKNTIINDKTTDFLIIGHN